MDYYRKAQLKMLALSIITGICFIVAIWAFVRDNINVTLPRLSIVAWITGILVGGMANYYKRMSEAAGHPDINKLAQTFDETVENTHRLLSEVEDLQKEITHLQSDVGAIKHRLGAM